MINIIYIAVVVAAIWALYAIFSTDSKKEVNKSSGGVGKDDGGTAL